MRPRLPISSSLRISRELFSSQTRCITLQSKSASLAAANTILPIRSFSRHMSVHSTNDPSKFMTLSDGVTPNAPLRIDENALTDPLVKLSPAPFLFYPAFLSPEEQDVLLSASLQKLDAAITPSRDVRKLRKAWRAEVAGNTASTNSPFSTFLPDDLYDFEEVSLGISLSYSRLSSMFSSLGSL